MEGLGWLWLVVDVIGVVALAAALAWALLLRRRRGGGASPSLDRLEPESEARRMGRANRWEDWANLILGTWLFISPWALQLDTGADALAGNTILAGLNARVIGALIAFLALAAVFELRLWEEWINLVLGAWLIVAPWVLGFAGVPRAAWDHWIVGALVIACAAWSVARLRGRVPRKEAEPTSARERRMRG